MPVIFSRADAIRHGVTDWQLRDSGIVRLRYDKYVASANDTEWHSWAAALGGLPDGAALCDVTALKAWQLATPWSQRDAAIHICVPAPYPPSRRKGVVIHQRTLVAGEIVGWRGLPVTSIARTFVDLAAILDLEELVATGDAILRNRRCSRGRLAEVIAGAAGRRGIALARTALPMLSQLAHSVPESLLRVRAIAAGLPPPEPQCPVYLPGADEPFAHLDLGYRKYRVGLEHEGRHHTEPRQFAIDTERHTNLATADWLVLRSSAADLAGGSARILGKLRQTLILRGWQPAGD